MIAVPDYAAHGTHMSAKESLGRSVQYEPCGASRARAIRAVRVVQHTPCAARVVCSAIHKVRVIHWHAAITEMRLPVNPRSPRRGSKYSDFE